MEIAMYGSLLVPLNADKVTNLFCRLVLAFAFGCHTAKMLLSPTYWGYRS